MQITNFFKGGNLLTLLLMSFLLIGFVFVNPVSAVVYENMFDDPIGLGHYTENVILVSEGTSPSSLVRFDTSGTGGAVVNIVDIPNYLEDACMGESACIVFILTDGKVYKFSGGAGYYSFVDDYNTTFQLLADVGGAFAGESRSIVVDMNSNIYISSDSNLYVLTYPSYSSSIFETIPIQSSSGIPDDISTIALHPDGILIGSAAQKGAGTEVYKYRIYLTDGTTLTTLYELPLGYNSNLRIDNIFSTSNGDVYFTANAGDIKRLNASDSYSVSTIASNSYVTDMYIDCDGIVYTSHSSDDTIKTYSTVDYSGGYSYSYYEGATGVQQLEYDTSTVHSVYAVYANDSIVEIAYNIDIDVSETSYADQFGFGQYGGSVAILEGFYWTIDLLNPSGMKIEDVSITNAVADDYGLFDYHVLATGEKQLRSSLWESGTWTLNLYEMDRQTGLRSLLDTDTYVIADNATLTDVTDVTPDVDPTLNPIDRINALLASNSFVGVLIMIACIGAFAKHGGVAGVVLGTVAGVSLAAMLGYVPMWFVFVMVLALAVVFTSKIVSGLGGDK